MFEEGTFIPQAKLQNGKSYSIITDHLGTPTDAYDEKGKKVWSRELDIYGKTRNFVGEENFVPFLYQGQYEDEETGLYYNRFRYYSPDTGCYISQDPIGLAGNNPNLYAYVSDINSWVDPLGLTPLGQGGFSVYGLYEAGAKEPYYIGISNDADRRALEHLGSGRLSETGEMRIFKGLEDVSYAEARGNEQFLIEKYKTKTGKIGEKIGPNNKGNKINSFNKSRTDVRGKKFKAEYDKAKAKSEIKFKSCN